jgi:predicted lipoprotein with Yx(FWY)xxD motif
MSRLLARTAFATVAICAASAAFADAPAKVAQTAKGAAFVDGKGKTLYTFDKDDGGKSACNGPCASAWPPLTAAAGSDASGDWTLVKRDDGSSQWAYRGHPLYTFVKDGNPGDANGDGIKDVWHLAKP